MAPPDADVLAPVEPVSHEHDVKGVHAGPDGTWLKGFAVADLNQFHYDVARTVKIPPPIPDEASIPRSQQGEDVQPYTIVEGPIYWKAADFKGEDNAHKWQYHLTEQDISEVDIALAAIQEKGIKIEDLRKEDFPLPTLGPKLEAIRDEVVHGKGFHLIRGFPTERYDRWQTVAIYYAFGLHWGNPQAQNAKGHIVGHIKAIGTDPKLVGTRPYTTSVAHGYHSDGSDIATLLCLRDAKEGGLSNWVSSVSIHNELLRRGRKDLVEVLTRGEFWLPAHNVWGAPEDTWTGPEDPAWVNFPLFHYHHNRLSVQAYEGAYYYAYRFPNGPRFTPLQEEALRTFFALAMSDELRLDHQLRPGDISLINNLTALHAKTAFVDHTDPDLARHLLRMWISPPNGIPLPEQPFLAKWGSVQIGSRGGYWLGHHYVRHSPLEAEYGDLESTRPEHLKGK